MVYCIFYIIIVFIYYTGQWTNVAMLIRKSSTRFDYWYTFLGGGGGRAREGGGGVGRGCGCCSKQDNTALVRTINMGEARGTYYSTRFCSFYLKYSQIIHYTYLGYFWLYYIIIIRIIFHQQYIMFKRMLCY